MSTDPYIKGVIPLSEGARRRYIQRRSPGSSIPPVSAPPDKFRQVQTSDLWQQQVVDQREALTMAVEELAMLDQFNPETRIDSPSFKNLPAETQLAMVRKLADEVAAAPSRKKEDANRNFVQQLGAGAGWIGKKFAQEARNTWDLTTIDAVQSWWGEKVSKPAMTALEWTGKESSSTIIGTAQKFIPGEQTHEKRQRLYREQKYKDKPANWWSRLGRWSTTFNANATYGFGPEGSEFAEPGFDVPMGVHLPLEILTDPANLIPISWVTKGVKVAKLTKAGRAYAAAEKAGLARMNIQETAKLAEKSAAGDRHRAHLARQTAYEAGLPTHLKSKEATLGGLEPDYLYEVKKVRMSPRAARREKRRRLAHHDDYVDVFGDLGMGRGMRRRGRQGAGKHRGEQRVGRGASSKLQVSTVLRKPRIPEVAVGSADHDLMPWLRGDPGAIKKLGAQFSALWDLTTKIEHPANRAVLQAMWYFGVRPGELANVKLGTQQEAMDYAFPELTMPIRGKGNNRRMFGGKNGDAFKFMQEWLSIRLGDGYSPGWTDEAGNPIPMFSPEATDVSGLGIKTDVDSDVFFVFIDGKNQPATATNINRILKESAESYGSEGEGLLNFYRAFENAEEAAGKGNNNYSYVFRLAAASRWLKESRASVGRSLQMVQQSMGHSSPRHTARYFSGTLFDHGSARDAFEAFGFNPDEIAKWVGDADYANQSAIGKFFSKLPGGKTAQQSRAELSAKKTRFLIENITSVLDDTSLESPTLVAQVPEDITRETASGIHKLEELENLMYYLETVIQEKGFIGPPYGGSKVQIDAARDAIAVLKSWRQPVVDAAYIIHDDIVRGGDELMPSEGLASFMNPFKMWETLITAEQLSFQKFSGLGRGTNRKDFLSGLLPRAVFDALEETPKGELSQSKLAKLARLSQEEIDDMNRQFDAAPEGAKQATIPNTKMVVKPTDRQLPDEIWETADKLRLAPIDARLGPNRSTAEFHADAGYLVRQETKEALSRMTWIVTEWVRDANNDIISARLKKLASRPTDPKTGWKLRFAQDAAEQEVPLTKLKEWRLIAEAPLPTDPSSSVFTSLIRPGRVTLSAEEIANWFFVSGGWTPEMSSTMTGWMSMTQLRRRMSVVGESEDLIEMGLDGLAVPERRRLVNSGLLEVRGTGNKTEYRFKDTLEDGSETVEDALNRLRVNHGHNEGWGSAALKDSLDRDVGGGGVPGLPAGPSMAAELPDDWNRLNIAGRTLASIIRIPFGMHQPGKIFSGTGWGRKLFALLEPERGFGPNIPALGRFNPGAYSIPERFQKIARTVVPGTWGASPGGRLVWTYRIAGQEGANVASEINWALQKSFQDAGIMTDDWSGRNLILRPDVDNPKVIEEYVRAKAASKKKPDYTGMSSEEIKDAKLAEAAEVEWLPGDGTFIARDGTPLPIPHPYNITRHRLFELFKHDHPDKWDNIAVAKDVRNWTYTQNTQFVGTFLATPRAHLEQYYVMTPQLQKAWDNYHEVQKQLVTMFEQTGHDIDELLGGVAWIDEYVPLLPTGKMGDPKFFTQPRAEMRGKVGVRPQTFLDRQYESHIQGKMMQGMWQGKTAHDVYNNNPLAALSRTVTQMYDYILDAQFLDAYSQLGLDKSIKMAPGNMWDDVVEPYRKLIKSGKLDEAEELIEGLSNGTLEKVIKIFGSNWKKMEPEIDERLKRILYRYRDANAASENVGRNKGLEYMIDTHKIQEIAFDHESSRELMVLGSDMIEPGMFGPMISKASAASNAMRVFATGADLGVLLLHGFGGIGMMMSPTGLLPASGNPFDWSQGMAVPMKARLAWGVGAKNMAHSMLQQVRHGKSSGHNVRREWYINTMAEREEMQKYGVAFFRSTFSEDLPTAEIFPDISVGKGVTRTKMAPAIERLKDVVTSPIDGFGFFLDVSKTEMWRAWKAADMTPDELSELAASLNAIHGTLNPSVSGIQNKQRIFESAFMSYAAMYRRSCMALINNAFNPNHLRAEKAWRRGPALHAISGMLTAGAAFGGAIMLLQDAGLIEVNDDLWNPGSPDFLAMKIGGQRFGIGTPFYSFIRMGTDVVDQMANDPKGIKPFSIRDNPVLKWGRSQTSPVSSFVTDLVLGETFIGEPLWTPDSGFEVNKIGDRIGRTLIPFWIESQLHTDTRSFRGSVGELMGMRVSPISPYARLQAARNVALNLSDDPDIAEWRQDRLRQGLPVTGQAMPRTLFKRLMETNPELLEIEKELSDQVQARGTDERKEQDDFINKVEVNRVAAQARMQGVAYEFAQGLMSGKAFREAITEIEVSLRAANRQVAGDHEQVLERFEERRSDRADRQAEYFVGDIIYDLYRSTVTNNPLLHDAYGNFNLELFLQFQDEFATKHADQWPYVQERIKENQQVPGLVGDYYKAKETLSEYWSIDEQLWGKGSWQVDLLNNWRMMQTQEAKELFESRNRQVSGLVRKLQYYQTQYRRQNPETDRLLVQFYDYAPQTALGRTVSKGRMASAASSL